MKTPTGISTLNRDTNFDQIKKVVYDVLVIGGGIMGAGIALDAASRNLKVLLVEKQDFAAGTSSRSTKLIHGGLRYLKNLEFGLVRTVARERKVLHRNAPHLVLPEPMLIPVLKKNSYGYWGTKAGLILYDWLGNVAAPERHRMLGKKNTLQQEPLLNPENLMCSGRFTEYRTDDARLTMEVLKTAQVHGATCLNYSEVTGFTYAENRQIDGAILQDRLTGKNFTVKASCVVNAAGPWTTKVMGHDQPDKLPALLHTKGVHLVLPFNKLPLRQSVYFDIPGGRMLFAIPRNNVTYLGTTDTPFTGKLENPVVDREDALYLLEEANKMFPSVNLSVSDVVSGWAGVRTLLFEAGKKPSEISRKDEVYTSVSGLITVAGGKLTGYRHLAEKVVDKALTLQFPDLNLASNTKNIRLSGGDFEDRAAVNAFLERCLQQGNFSDYPEENIKYLVQSYGSNTNLILEMANLFKTEGSRPEKVLLKAEVWYGINFEGATNLSDFLVRRTGKLYFERDKIEGLLPDVTAAFREFLHWDEQNSKKYTAEFLTLFEAAVAFKKI